MACSLSGIFLFRYISKRRKFANAIIIDGYRMATAMLYPFLVFRERGDS